MKAFLITFLFSIIANAQSGIYISVGQANLKKSLMAIPLFQFQGSPVTEKDALKTGKLMFDTFSNDMSVTSYFEFIKQEAFPAEISKQGLRPAPSEAGGFDFAPWKKLETDFLVRVGYRLSDGDIVLEAYIYHVPQAKLIISKSYRSKIENAKFIAHTLANEVIFALTGKKGIFTTKIVAVLRGKGTVKEIITMDWDCTNPKPVTNSNTISISPAWSPDGKLIAYTSYAFHPKEKMRNPDLFIYEYLTRKRFLISSSKGRNSGAAFLPNSKEILFTSSKDGNPDIYKIDIEGENLKQIKSGPRTAMNVEPAVSPDGKKIAFSSDRGGQPMIYLMNIDGSGAVPITTAGEFNSTPAWSPDGKKIAFAGQDKDHFDIFLMDADGTNMTRLTSARKSNGRYADNENPSFSPDGRHILFTSNRSGVNQIYMVNPDGTNEIRLSFDRNDYFQPKWSPYLD